MLTVFPYLYFSFYDTGNVHNIQTSANETHSKISFQTTGSETSSRPEIGLKNSKLLEVHDDDDGEYPATINKTAEDPLRSM